MTIDEHISAYRDFRPKYEQLCAEVRRILGNSFSQTDLRTHSIEARAKSIDSFRRKLEKTNDDGTPKYNQPLTEITDLAAVRVITYTIDDISEITRFIDNHFDIIEKRDVGEERAEKGQFGYQSIHYLVNLTKDRLALPDYSIFHNLVCEIQVRTVLQHAWAEMEHDIQYKGSANIPKSVRRKFLALAGLLEIADREFTSIQREDKNLKLNVLSDLQRDLTLDELEKSTASEPEKAKTGYSQREPEQEFQVRNLLALGKYKEAIGVYNQKIEFEPTSYTLFIGRARALFLSGETEQALRDIDRAEQLQPDNPMISALRSKIVEGSLAEPQQDTNKDYKLKIKLGDDALSDGRPEAAYRLYLDALGIGASWPFTTFKLALASATAGDLTGAELHLNELRIHPGTPMEINIAALRAILSLIKGSEDFPQRIERLRSLRKEMEDFNIKYSPLILLEGMDGKRFWADKNAQVEEVLEVLR